MWAWGIKLYYLHHKHQTVPLFYLILTQTHMSTSQLESMWILVVSSKAENYSHTWAIFFILQFRRHHLLKIINHIIIKTCHWSLETKNQNQTPPHTHTQKTWAEHRVAHYHLKGEGHSEQNRAVKQVCEKSSCASFFFNQTSGHISRSHIDLNKVA